MHTYQRHYQAYFALELTQMLGKLCVGTLGRVSSEGDQLEASEPEALGTGNDAPFSGYRRALHIPREGQLQDG